MGQASWYQEKQFDFAKKFCADGSMEYAPVHLNMADLVLNHKMRDNSGTETPVGVDMISPVFDQLAESTGMTNYHKRRTTLINPLNNLEPKSGDPWEVRQQENISWQYGKIHEYYENLKEIGMGSFGSVNMGQIKESHQIRAIKSVDKKLYAAEWTEQLIEEANVLKFINHPNIMQLYELIEDQVAIHLVGELYKGGDLLDVLCQQRTMTEKQAANYMQQILDAMKHCHANDIVHRDLKLENILLQFNQKDSPLVIIDFGTSQVFDINNKLHNVLGTPSYVAPEVIEGHYDAKSDVWSWGVILYCLLSGHMPYSGDTIEQIMHSIQNEELSFHGIKWNRVSSQAKDLLRGMLLKSSEERYTMEQWLEHPWIANDKDSTTLLPTDNLKVIRDAAQQYRVQKMILSFIDAQKATREELTSLLNLYIGIDVNEYGVVSRNEIISSVGYNYSVDLDIEGICDSWDPEGIGYVDYRVFLVATAEMHKSVTNEKLSLAFHIIDEDNSGRINLSEIKQVMDSITHAEDDDWRKIINEADIDGDGEIDESEFFGLMQIMIPNKE